MKYRRTRQVTQGASNYNSTPSVRSTTRDRIRPSTAQHFKTHKNSLHDSHSVLSTAKARVSRPGTTQQLFSRQRKFNTIDVSAQSPVKNSFNRDVAYCQPKVIVNSQMYPLPKTKVQQVLSSLKNSCEYKKYQYFNVFNFFDVQKTGKVDSSAMKEMIKAYGYDINDQEAKEIIQFFKKGESALQSRKQYHEQNRSQNKYAARMIVTEENIANKGEIDQTFGQFPEQTSPQKGWSKGEPNQFFTVENFMTQIGNYSEPELKVTGDPLQRKLTEEKPKRTRKITGRRNSSINMKSVLLNHPSVKEFREKSKCDTIKQKIYEQNDKQANTEALKKVGRRNSRFALQVNPHLYAEPEIDIKPNNDPQKRQRHINSENHLIPRSNLQDSQSDTFAAFQKKTALRENLPVEFAGPKDLKREMRIDQLAEQEKAKEIYKSKLRKICEHNQDLNQRCRAQQMKADQQPRFSENFGMLSQLSSWRRS